MRTATKIPAREKLLQAALRLIREKGYSATTVDDLCTAAGVTKGAFFHHFATKEDLGVAAAEHWSAVTAPVFASAPYHRHPDPLDRVLGYVDFRKALIRGEIPEFTCLVGTMVQEIYESSPPIRDACLRSIVGHAGTLLHDIADAKRRYAPDARFTSESLAMHTQAVLQGAYVLAKARHDSFVAEESIEHLRTYIELLFPRDGR